MDFNDRFIEFFGGNNLYRRVFIVCALFFIVPAVGLVYLAVKYDILKDIIVVPALFVSLLLILLGFRMLRKTLDNIKNISTDLAKTAETATQKRLKTITGELDSIVLSFQSLQEELKEKNRFLEKKAAETEMFKEFSDLSYMTLNADYLLFIALERVLKLVNADTGSVMMLSRPDKRSFVIKASIGPGEYTKKGTVTPFDDSIAKYTVINKAPLLVKDIETDPRFGRPARGQYSTKSFICMPLKTSNEVIGVITISRRMSDVVFTPDDVNILTPLLSNVAYIYDNINMNQSISELTGNIQALRRIAKTINSSMKGQEMAQEIFEQIRKNIAFDTIVLLKMLDASPGKLSVVEFVSFIPTNLSRGRTFTYEGSIIERAVNEQRNLFIHDVHKLTSYIDKKVFGRPDVQTALIIPLKVEGRVTSVILIFNIQKTDWLRLNEVLNLMGDQLSLAMEKERLIESLVKRDRVLDTVRLIGQAITASTFDTEQILAHTMEMIQSVLPVEAGYLMMPQDDELTYAASFHLDMQKLKTMKLPKGTGVAGHVFDSGVSLVVNSAQEYPNFLPDMEYELGFNPRTILCVPVISQGKVNGVISVLNKTEGAFNEADEKMLQTIATFVGTALENSQRYRDALTGTDKTPLLDI
ncbi:MAG: GAF domain-containing protein [Smithellaceae bacterium]|jgi:GAF domain-containing protein|nr:GAF domain-containing protein [Syntrophaceae bacterium]HPL97124.1 GAF domain-containing protein [Smithellaceae bacterium]